PAVACLGGRQRLAFAPRTRLIMHTTCHRTCNATCHRTCNATCHNVTFDTMCLKACFSCRNVKRGTEIGPIGNCESDSRKLHFGVTHAACLIPHHGPVKLILAPAARGDYNRPRFSDHHREELRMSPDQDVPRSGVSRRAFLKGSGVAAAATALAQAPAQALADDKATGDATTAIGPGAVRIELNVNGSKMSTSVEPRVTLLDALRDYLDVT